MNIKTSTIVRMAVLIVALANQLFVTLGYQALPWSGEEIGGAISTLITIFAAAWAWWKNNSLTEEAIAADKVLDAQKQGLVSSEEVEYIIEQDNPHFAGNFDDEGNFIGEGAAEEVE